VSSTRRSQYTGLRIITDFPARKDLYLDAQKHQKQERNTGFDQDTPEPRVANGDGLNYRGGLLAVLSDQLGECAVRVEVTSLFIAREA
jgi:hypothetical protein